MTIDEIKELIHVVHETGIAELEVQRGDNRVRIRRSTGATQDVVVPAVLPVPVTAVSAAAPAIPQPLTVGESTASLPPPPPPAPPEDSRDSVVKSPIVGTYYD